MRLIATLAPTCDLYRAVSDLGIPFLSGKGYRVRKGDPLRDIICVTKYEVCGQTLGAGVIKH